MSLQLSPSVQHDAAQTQVSVSQIYTSTFIFIISSSAQYRRGVGFFGGL